MSGTYKIQEDKTDSEKRSFNETDGEVYSVGTPLNNSHELKTRDSFAMCQTIDSRLQEIMKEV